jgi:hypothetical protein
MERVAIPGMQLALNKWIGPRFVARVLFFKRIEISMEKARRTSASLVDYDPAFPRNSNTLISSLLCVLCRETLPRRLLV